MDQNKGKVCVTGASGFLASWLIKRLLLSGYQVIGTVRNPGCFYTPRYDQNQHIYITTVKGNEEKVGHLRKFEGANKRLTLMKADLMEEGSFDSIIHGCCGVFHTASPVGGSSSNPRVDILEPAIKGTLNVLRSCKRNPFLKRVILTSSSSTLRVRDDLRCNEVIDEASWSSTELCERLKLWYSLSKTQAEKAAWEFCNDNKIDLVTVLPSFIIGPSLPKDLCSTATDVLELLKGEVEKFQWHGRMGYVHIDDVAMCHILLFENNNAKGRYICSSSVIDNDELVSILSERYPWLPIPKRFEQHDRQKYYLDTSKIKGFDYEFKTIEEMFDDCIASLIHDGHLPSYKANAQKVF